MKVAIVHDWLIGGGAERVVMEISKMYPDAPIYTSYISDEWRERLAPAKIVTGYLQNFPRLRKYLTPLRQHWFSHLDFSGFDLVISSTGNGEAKGIRVPEGTTHVCYCHSPTHFYWRHYDQYLAQPGFGLFNPLVRVGLKVLVRPLRRWDLKASKLPDYYIANSTHIQNDIKRYYGRDSEVIHPPIDISRFKALVNKQNRAGFVTVGRQVPFKKTDLIVRACTELNLPLTVIGRGPEHENLKTIAGPTVQFLSDATDADVADQMSKAAAFIFASYEDFGITPVEAMASGTPVIAYQAGGALDYVKPGVTGEFFEAQTVDSLVLALKKFKPEKYDPQIISQSAEQFSPEHFVNNLKGYLKRKKVV